MSKHTPEPWYIQPDPWPPSIRDGEHGAEIAYAKSPYTNPEYRTLERANSNRIVACVNACKDLADPAAEIKAMRKVCSAALRYRNGKYSGDCERQEQAWFDVVRALDDALAVLKALDAALAALKAEGEVKSG